MPDATLLLSRSDGVAAPEHQSCKRTITHLMRREKAPIPALARLWVLLYHAVPKLRFPGSTIDWGFSIACRCFVWVARLVLLRVLYRFGWPIGAIITKSAAGSLAGGLFHSPNLVPLSFVLMRFVQTYDPAGPAKDMPKWWQDAADAIIQLCTGYMLCDTIVGLCFDRWVPGQGLAFDGEAWLFLAHHIISLLYLLSTRILGAGQQSMLVCFLIGEASNPPFCAYLICQMAITLDCCSGPFAMQVVSVVEVINALVYIPCRAFIGPFVGGHMSYLILTSKSAQTNLPLAIRIMWTMILWGIAIGSIPYIFKFTDDLKRHLGGSIMQEL